MISSGSLENEEQIVGKDKRISSIKEFTFFFLLVQFLGFYLFGGLRTVYPLFLNIHLNLNQVQVVQSWAIIYTVGQFLGFFTRVPMGIFADKFSRHTSLLLALIITVFSIFSMLFVTDILILALLFGLLRTGTHLFPLITRSYVNAQDPHHHGRLNGLVMFSANLGGILAPIIFAFLLAISVPLMIISTSIFIILAILFLFMTIPNEKIIKNISIKNRLKKSANDILKLKELPFFFLIAGLINGIFTSIQSEHLYYAFHFNESTVGIIVGIIQTLSLVLILIVGELTDKIGTKKIIISGFVLELFGGILSFIFIIDLNFFIIGQILLSGGNTTIVTGSTTKMSINADHESFATTFGAISGFFFLGSSLAPIWAGFLYIEGTYLPYLVIILISGFILPILFKILKKEKHNIFLFNH